MDFVANKKSLMLDNLLRTNFITMAPIACVVFILLAFIDASLSHRSLFLFLAVRIIFILPTFFVYLFLRKNKTHNIELMSLITFGFAGVGVSVISYLLGGITSDYYFGLLIVSLLQLTFTPIRMKHALSLELFLTSVFFTLNYLPFDHSSSLLIKQISNYASYAVFKFIAIKQYRKFMFDSFDKIELEQEIENRKQVDSIFSELCHQVNNPLFISKGLTKQILKNELVIADSSLNEKVIKSYKSQERIQEVLLKLQNLKNQKEVAVADYRSSLQNKEQSSQP
ncbi:hypothetical protein [Halobacteriovorax sp. HLS]|uniref:hypothetical protein n=1 Tax=Halobacteriovorax sp. HLS TaxID=2234000 RepID=UPI000FDA629C|nr:hypothetical protein [Halobacteriovorax sp. HLS]